MEASSVWLNAYEPVSLTYQCLAFPPKAMKLKCIQNFNRNIYYLKCVSDKTPVPHNHFQVIMYFLLLWCHIAIVQLCIHGRTVVLCSPNSSHNSIMHADNKIQTNFVGSLCLSSQTFPTCIHKPLGDKAILFFPNKGRDSSTKKEKPQYCEHKVDNKSCSHSISYKIWHSE